LGGRDWEDKRSRPAQKLARPHLSQQKLGVVAVACHLAMPESINLKIMVQVRPCTKQDPVSKIIKAKRLEVWLK
jgi:hypothetical protein